MAKTKYNPIYYQTQEWINKKNLMLEWYPQCQLCGSKEKIQVHHKHYWTFKDEMPWDLKVLCEPCHRKKHLLDMIDGDVVMGV